MAIQGSLLFVLARSLQEEPAFEQLNKANPNLEALPDNFNRRYSIFWILKIVPLKDNFRDMFRVNIETAICDFCSESVNECNRTLARLELKMN